MEEVNKKEVWNKKRIFIAVFLLLALTAGAFFLRTRFYIDSLQNTKSVKGIEAEENLVRLEPKINVQDAVREKINSLKQDVSSLNVLEIASSSPQVQKILNDIESLQQYPENQIKEICRKICGL